MNTFVILEPFAVVILRSVATKNLAQDKLREESPDFKKIETLRYTQGDIKRLLKHALRLASSGVRDSQLRFGQQQ